MNDHKSFNRDKYDLDFSKIHKIINPLDIRLNDRIEARIKVSGEQDFTIVRVWKMSPLGVELVQPQGANTFKKGESLDLELLVAGQRVEFEGLVVDITHENEEISLLGIRFKRPENNQSDKVERRGTPRWLCSPDYYPTASCPTPGQISDYMRFKIKDISSDGLLLSCSLRNKMPFPGLILSLTANFGIDGTFTTPVEITRVGFATEAGKDRLAVGVKFKKCSTRMKSIMGQYLIQFSSSATLDDLRNEGFWPESIANAVNFYFLTTEAEYKSVLDLRKRAHDADENLKAEVSTEDMGDMLDGHARIIIGSHLGRIVCTARVKFGSEDEPLEHENFVDWPDHLPKRSEILEIGRLALDPHYRHGDLLLGLFEYIAVTCVHDRSYVVMSCLERMLGFFESVGFKKTGLTYDGSLFNQPGIVMIGNAKETMLGKDVNPLFWNLVWSRVSDYMIDAQLIDPKGMDQARLTAYRLFAPLARFVKKYKAWQLRQKHS